jgi:hypothetical protein
VSSKKSTKVNTFSNPKGKEVFEKNPFKNSLGVYYIKALFFEYDDSPDKETAIYTLKDEDWFWRDRKFLSLSRLYILEEDPAEYQFAEKYFDGWKHWKRVSTSALISPYIREMREELSALLLSRALKDMIEVSKGKGREATMAHKFLIDKGWEAGIEKKPGKPVGRPLKPKKSSGPSESEIDEDYERIIGSGNGSSPDT